MNRQGMYLTLSQNKSKQFDVRRSTPNLKIPTKIHQEEGSSDTLALYFQTNRASCPTNVLAQQICQPQTERNSVKYDKPKITQSKTPGPIANSRASACSEAQQSFSNIIDITIKPKVASKASKIQNTKTRNDGNLKSKKTDPYQQKTSPPAKRVTSKSVQDKNQDNSVADQEAENLKRAISRSIQKISALAQSAIVNETPNLRKSKSNKKSTKDLKAFGTSPPKLQSASRGTDLPSPAFFVTQAHTLSKEKWNCAYKALDQVKAHSSTLSKGQRYDSPTIKPLIKHSNQPSKSSRRKRSESDLQLEESLPATNLFLKSNCRNHQGLKIRTQQALSFVSQQSQPEYDLLPETKAFISQISMEIQTPKVDSATVKRIQENSEFMSYIRNSGSFTTLKKNDQLQQKRDKMMQKYGPRAISTNQEPKLLEDTFIRTPEQTIKFKSSRMSFTTSQESPDLHVPSQVIRSKTELAFHQDLVVIEDKISILEITNVEDVGERTRIPIPEHGSEDEEFFSRSKSEVETQQQSVSQFIEENQCTTSRRSRQQRMKGKSRKDLMAMTDPYMGKTESNDQRQFMKIHKLPSTVQNSPRKQLFENDKIPQLQQAAGESMEDSIQLSPSIEAISNVRQSVRNMPTLKLIDPVQCENHLSSTTQKYENQTPTVQLDELSKDFIRRVENESMLASSLFQTKAQSCLISPKHNNTDSIRQFEDIKVVAQSEQFASAVQTPAQIKENSPAKDEALTVQIPSVTIKDDFQHSDLLASLNEAPKTASDLDLMRTGSEMMLIDGDDYISDDNLMNMLDESPAKKSPSKQSRNANTSQSLFAYISKQESPEDVNFFSQSTFGQQPLPEDQDDELEREPAEVQLQLGLKKLSTIEEADSELHSVSILSSQASIVMRHVPWYQAANGSGGRSQFSPGSSCELESVNYSASQSQTFSSFVNKQPQDIPPPVPKLQIQKIDNHPLADPSNCTEEESSCMFDRAEMQSPIMFSNRSAFERASEKAAKNQVILSQRNNKPDDEESKYDYYAIPKSARVAGFAPETNVYHQQSGQQGNSDDFASSISRGLNSSSSQI